jgi:hypothetical protein
VATAGEILLRRGGRRNLGSVATAGEILLTTALGKRPS